MAGVFSINNLRCKFRVYIYIYIYIREKIYIYIYIYIYTPLNPKPKQEPGHSGTSRAPSWYGSLNPTPSDTKTQCPAEGSAVVT